MTKKQLDEVKADVGDYVVVKTEKKNVLAKVIAKSGTNLKGPTSKNWDLHKTFNETDVLANVGPSPPRGSAYGVRIEMLKGRIKKLNCDLYTEISQEQQKVLEDILEKRENLLNQFSIRLAIREKKGKVAGEFVASKKGKDTLILADKTLDDETLADYVLCHEIGHGVWERKLNAKLRRPWIEMYHGSVKVTEGDMQLIKKIAERFDEKKLPVNRFASWLEKKQERRYAQPHLF